MLGRTNCVVHFLYIHTCKTIKGQAVRNVVTSCIKPSVYSYFRLVVFSVDCLLQYFDLTGVTQAWWKISPHLKTAIHSFRYTVLSCLLTVEGWAETPVDVFRSEGVELDVLLSVKKLYVLFI